MRERRAGTALLLIALGIMFLLGNYFNLGTTFLAIIGLFLLVAYFALGRSPGFLIPGGILTGLGLGVYAANVGALGGERGWWPLILVGLGVGFLLIWALERSQRWAVLPGSIISALGLLFLLTTLGGIIPWGVWRSVGDWWPLILIALGLWMMYRQWRPREG